MSSNRIWICPYYSWDKPQAIYCEGGVLRFHDGAQLQEYAGRFCGSYDWHRCTVARSLEGYYDRALRQAPAMPRRIVLPCPGAKKLPGQGPAPGRGSARPDGEEG